MATPYAQGLWLSAEPIAALNDELIPELQLQLPAEQLANLLHRIPWTTGETWDNESHEAPAAITLRPTEYHGRSTILDIRTLENSKLTPKFTPHHVWQDEYGNPYTSLSYKGNVADEIAIQAGTSDPEGIRFHGLQTTYALERCLKASRLFREANIDTELITAALLPFEMPFRGKIMSPRSVKQILHTEQVLLNSKDKAAELQIPRASFRMLHGPSDEQLKNMTTALNESEFVVTGRAMLVSERLLDLVENPETAVKILNRALMVVHRTNISFTGDHESPVEAYESLMGEVMPYRLGTNLRKIQKLGLAHRMLHSGNINVLGGIVDLDSVVGKAIGLIDRDDGVTQADAIRDVGSVCSGFDRNDSISSMFKYLQEDVIIRDAEALSTRYYRNLFRGYFAITDTESSSNEDISIGKDTFLKLIFDANRVRYSKNRLTVWEAMDIIVENLDHQVAEGATDYVKPASPQMIKTMKKKATENIPDQPHNQNIIKAMSDLVDERILRQAAVDCFTSEIFAGDNFPLLLEAVLQTYRQTAIRTAIQLDTIPAAKSEIISGRNIQVLANTSLVDALHQLESLDLSEIIIKSHREDKDHTSSVETDAYQESVLYASDTTYAELYEEIVEFHKSAFRNKAWQYLKKNKMVSVFIHSLPVPSCKKENYLLYVRPGDNGHRVYIHSYEQLEVTKKLLAEAGMDKVTVTHIPGYEVERTTVFLPSFSNS